MKKKKIIFEIFILLFFTFFAYLIYDSINFNKINSKTTKEKAVRVTFVEIDKDKVTDENFKDTSYLDYFLGTFSIEEDLKKEGEYYVATISDINDIAFKRIKKITTGLNDTQANLVDDVKYDEKTRKIFIPTKYYDDSKYSTYDGATIRLELVNAITKKELNKIYYDVNITKFKTETKTNTSKFYFEEPQISIFEYKKGRYISKKDMKIYINGSKTPLSEKKYKWNNKSGVISFDSYTFYLNKVDIKIKKTALLKNFFFSIFNFSDALAEDANSNSISFEVNDTAGKKGISYLNEVTVSGSYEYYYATSSGYYHNGDWSDDDMPDDVADSSIQANATIFKDVERTAKYWAFYIYVPEIKFSKSYKYNCDSDGNNCKTGTVTATIKVNKWLRSACSNESNTGTRPKSLDVTFKLSVEDSENLFVGYNSTNHVTTQYAAGGFRTTGTTYKLKIQKKVYDESSNSFVNWNKKGVVFRLYSGFKGVNSDGSVDDSDCNGVVIDSKTTNKNGQVTFSGLSKSGKYCVKELFNETTKNSTVSKYDYARDANCNGYTERKGGYEDKVLTAYTTNTGGTAEYGNSYCNIRRKYCLAVKKIDAETGCAVNGIDFVMNNVRKTTSGNGFVIYNNLGFYSNNTSGTGDFVDLEDKDVHYVKEVSNSGTIGTLTGGNNCSGSFRYWNDSSEKNNLSYEGIAFKDSELTEMSRSVNSNGEVTYNTCIESDFTNAKTKTQSDHKQYYCAVVKKVDAITRTTLQGAKFVIGNSNYGINSSNGISYFFLGTDSSKKVVTEVSAPSGYAVGESVEVTPILMPEGTESDGTKGSKSFIENCKSVASTIPAIEYEDHKWLLNWYKTTEGGYEAAGAKFIVRYTDNSSNITYYVKAGSKESQTDASIHGISKNCYKYTGLTTNESEATKFESDGDGEACISGIIDNGKKKYTVEEVEPAAYHTFDSSNSKQISISTTFAANDANNTFINYQTKFEFTKTVYDVTDYDEETIKQLKKLKFNIKNSEGTVLSFKLVNGIYEYDGNTKDKPATGTVVQDLTLNDARKIIVQHLPIGNYTIEEKDNTCSTTDTSCECIGYYYDSTKKSFEIKSNYDSKASTSMVNYSTKVEFTKKDLYENINNGSTVVKFENDEEVKAFDDIGFKIKKGGKDGQDITNHLVEETPGSGVYRYVSYKTTTKELHTNNGTLTITNLCKNTMYTIVENSVPAHSIFALVNSPSVTFTVDNEKPEFTQKVEISDEPTRMEIEKKDLETKELITTPGATFEVYRCKAGQTCGDTFDKSKTVLVKFYDKETINDETVYRYAANQSSKGLVSSLSLTSGKIIMRYLPAGFRYYVIETKAPDGYYELSGDQKLITFVQLNDNITTKSSPTNKPVSIKFTKDDILKYYNSSDASKAESEVKIFDSMKFKLYDSKGKVLSLRCVEVNGKKYNSETKMCESGVYRYLPTNKSNIMQEINTINGTLRITHLYNSKKYYVEETKADSEGIFILPTNRHYNNPKLPFDNKGHPVVTYNVPSTAPAEGDNSVTQLIENSPTRVVFEKRDFTTNELIDDEQMPAGSTKTTFRIYMCAENAKTCTKEKGTLLHFEDRSVVDGDDGLRSYKYSKLNVGKITDLITDKGKLIIRYLPSNYKYIIYESIAPAGYYNPDEIKASISFTVKGTTESDKEDYESVTEIIQNTPTELYFKKEDLYKYYNTSDVASASNLTKLFDTMRFRLYNSKGEILSLKCVKKNGKGYNSKTKTCESGEYRYLPLKEKTEEEEKKVVRMTELNTINGEFKVTHLYRNSAYYIEEIKSDDEGVFILPNYLTYEGLPFKNNGHPVVKYQLPDKKPDSYESVTEVIDNIPTRVRLEKRDSKYGYLIDDETTTFNVYSCEKTVSKCTEENGTLIYFSKRAVINGDKEDNGIEVYKYSKTNAKAVSDLHPYHGVLVLRYLPSKYKYVLVETKSPKGYVLPDGENKNTNFEVRSETTDIEEVDVPNKPTSLLIKKYSDDGKLLPGAEFKVYEGTSCDANLSAMNQPKKLLKLKTIRDGLYENRPEQDTDTVLTCTDKEGAKCSDISTNTMTKLTYNDYINSWVNFDNSVDDEGNKVNLQEGEALIQYLEYNHCYIIEETKAPKGYSLPKNDEDRFTMVTITEDPSIKTTKKELINKPTPFTFYKYDEYNNLLDGAEFKLQKLDSNKKYHDITVTKEETETGVFYKVDKSTDNKVITTKDGKATVYYLEEGQYRIVETKAAPGKELGKNPNVATFFVDSAGNVYGNSIIVNKAKTETITFTSSASAEFLIWNRTGQTVIKYGLIISSIVAIIVALMVALRIKKKSD